MDELSARFEGLRQKNLNLIANVEYIRSLPATQLLVNINRVRAAVELLVTVQRETIDLLEVVVRETKK